MSRSSYITIENPDVHNLHNLRPLRKRPVVVCGVGRKVALAQTETSVLNS